MLKVLAAAAFCASAAVTDKSLPDALRAELGRVEASAQRSETFRKLLAENDGIERRLEELPPPEFVRYERLPARRLVYDPARIKTATEWELQVAEARELSRATLSLAAPLVEAEAAVWQRTLLFALELAAVEPAFSQAWAQRARRAQAEADKARRYDDWTKTRSQRIEKLPETELERLALFAALLAQGPERFYEAVGQLAPLPPDACRLAEVQDFMALHGEKAARLKTRDGDTFTLVAGARYPTRVVRAAQALLPDGGVEFAKEAIGPADAEAVELSRRLRHWLKWPTP